MYPSTSSAEAARRVNLLPFHPAPPPAPALVRREGLSRAEAEDLLDWLGANKCPHVELSLDGNWFCVTYCWAGLTHREGTS